MKTSLMKHYYRAAAYTLSTVHSCIFRISANNSHIG